MVDLWHGVGSSPSRAHCAVKASRCTDTRWRTSETGGLRQATGRRPTYESSRTHSACSRQRAHGERNARSR